MIVFPCHVCATSLSADEAQIGQLVRCPTCLTTLRVPAVAERALAATSPVGAGAGRTPAGPSKQYLEERGLRPGAFRGGGGAGKRYGFNCGYCSSRLEATGMMAGQDGQCPTCGN